jgi:putative transcriptional regulator
MMTSQIIRDLRTRLRMTQEEFAHAIAVTVSTVNRWENGHVMPSRLALRAIASLARKRGTTFHVDGGANGNGTEAFSTIAAQ